MTGFPKSLLKGYSEFKKGRHRDESERYKNLAQVGQSPECMVIACCDSRAAPETLFNSGPGEIFVVRNIANIVPPCTPGGAYHSAAAALEYAVQVLNVKHILVLGHSSCGGIKAALDPNLAPLAPEDSLGKWLKQLEPVAATVTSNSDITESERQTALERISIRNSIENLRTFPYIKRLEDADQLQLHGAWFDISGGELLMLDPETGEFGVVSSG